MSVYIKITIVIMLLFMSTTKAFPQNTITFDPVTGNYIINYQSLDPAIGQVQLIFEPPTKVKPVILPTVEFQSTGVFQYQYKIKNLKEALQKIQIFELESLSSVVNITKPDRFYADISLPKGGTLIWGALDKFNDIPPGQSKSGFGFSSEGLPQVSSVRVFGRRNIQLRFPDEPPSDIDEQLGIVETKPENAFVSVPTVASGLLPGTLTSIQLLYRLISLKDQAAQLGWITNQGVVNSLNVKLKAAKMHLERGEIKTAINILHAFIHELEAQRGKHLDDNAFYLLKPNVEYLIFKLQNP